MGNSKNMKLGTWCAGLVVVLAATGCATDGNDPADLVVENTVASPVIGGSCTLGDGYVIPSGGSKIIYPVSCGSDCDDYPNGGLDYGLFCLNGVLGEWDPALAGGTVGPAINGLQFNGYSRCTALANPYRLPHYGQSADRKHCVVVP